MEKLSFAPIFGDGMVLQRNKELTIWGKASGEGPVRAYLGDYRSESNVINGEWKCSFPPMEAATGLTLLAKQGGEAIRVQNIMIGDVWLAGGQSNMEFFLRYEAHFEEARALPKNPMIRMYTCPRIAFEGQKPYQSGCGYWFGEEDPAWETFSSAAYWFARELQPQLDVPVGIISCNWGGTSASAWIPAKSLEGGELEVYLRDYETAISGIDPVENKNASMRGWAFQEDPVHMKEWAGVMYGIDRHAQLERLVNRAGNPAVPMGPYNKNRPGCLYEQMVAPIKDCAIKGVLWYQGENDVHHAPLYSKLFETLIFEWRKIWGQDIPFIFAQLAPFGEWLALDGKLFPEIRMQQEIISKTVPNCYMISTSDVGMRYDIHPKEKKILGHRYFLQAMDKIYGMHCLADAPMLHSVDVSENEIKLTFGNIGTNMYIEASDFTLFELYHEVERISIVSAEKKDNIIVLRTSHKIPMPVTISFGYTPYYQVHLYNSAKIPCVPFVVQVP